MLSDSDSEPDEDLHRLTINDHYEKAFNAKKEREELERRQFPTIFSDFIVRWILVHSFIYSIIYLVKEELGSDASENDESDSEEDESEDEFGEELTPAADVAILRTLARIKSKDPSIYEESVNVYEGVFNTDFG